MDDLLLLALREDHGEHGASSQFSGDITTNACIESNLISNAYILAKEGGVLFGHDVAARVFSLLDERVSYTPVIPDSGKFFKGDILARIAGPLRAILTGERIALNFLQRLSAIASATSKVCELVLPYGTRIQDTRKTTPGFRLLEKAAIRAGGGSNHRMGLYDQFLIKNNHIDALNGDVRLAIKKCREYKPDIFLKVEVRDWNEIEQAMSEVPNGLLLDNFSPEELTGIVPKVRSLAGVSNVILEASGGVTIDTVVDFAKSGIDEISLGSLTHSIRSLDISLRFMK